MITAEAAKFLRVSATERMLMVRSRGVEAEDLSKLTLHVVSRRRCARLQGTLHYCQNYPSSG